MSESFQVRSLPSEVFAELFELDDSELLGRGARRMRATAKPGFPCRVSLADAEVGEEVILLGFEHQAADSPYRGQGAIFVRQGARSAALEAGQLPEMLSRRAISVRAYDAAAMMVDAAVVDGEPALRTAIERMLESDRVAYLHLHNAGPGCFNCRVDRA
jgi:hypothetical protein